MRKAKDRPLSILFKVLWLSFCVINLLAGAGFFRRKLKPQKQKTIATHTVIEDNLIQLSLKAHDGMPLSTTVFPRKHPEGIVQILHGATEHKELYYSFAYFLNNNGYAVIISDYRGHGNSVNDTYPYGHMKSVDELVEDAYSVTHYIKEMYPGCPLYIVGHSLGSILARCYLQTHDAKVEKLVMTGTIKPVGKIKLWLFMGNWVTFYFGPRRHSKFLHIVGGSTIYKALPYPNNFVTTDKEMFEKMRADSLMHFKWTNNGALTMLEAANRIKESKKNKAQNPTLPILSLSGAKDPMTGGVVGLRDTEKNLRKMGYSDIFIKQYDGKLHSILFETNRNSVYQDILNFFKE